ncbi:MAG: hypothetical protein GF398_11250 [Chitinivibrionales bacterium]|nr:hypothetical protein [Chitinivibrionales bacterium]
MQIPKDYDFTCFNCGKKGHDGEIKMIKVSSDSFIDLCRECTTKIGNSKKIG